MPIEVIAITFLCLQQNIPIFQTNSIRTRFILNDLIYQIDTQAVGRLLRIYSCWIQNKWTILMSNTSRSIPFPKKKKYSTKTKMYRYSSHFRLYSIMCAFYMNWMCLYYLLTSRHNTPNILLKFYLILQGSICIEYVGLLKTHTYHKHMHIPSHMFVVQHT